MIIVSIEKGLIIDLMHNILAHVPPKYYADVLYDSLATTTVRKSNSGEIVTVPHTRGYVFRIYDGAHFHELADINISKLESRVAKLMPTLAYNSKYELYHSDPEIMDTELHQKINVQEIPLEEKITRIRNIYTQMKSMNEAVVNPIMSYQDSILKRIFVNTEGSELRQVIPRIRFMLQPLVSVEGKTDADFKYFSGEAGFEIMDKIDAPFLDDAIQSSINLALAPLPPSGNFQVILDPSLAGLIAHESFGHGLEADQIIRERSYLSAHFKKRIAAEMVNISDSPAIKGEMGSYLFDDEGIISQKTPLVENGIFTHYLHNRLTAGILHDTPRGNGRRQSFMHPVYPRMSNTFFEPGSHRLEEMISEIKDGVMLSTGSFGMEDPLGGGIQCTSQKGFLIKNGEKGQLTKGITISGNVLSLLNSISAVSNTETQLDGGMCGKGTEDYVPVSSGGVYLRADKAIISPG